MNDISWRSLLEDEWHQWDRSKMYIMDNEGFGIHGGAYTPPFQYLITLNIIIAV